MNEISRVLLPGGFLYALTPCFPGAEAFQDPTHVNIMTAQTHRYFTGLQPLGRMYGFTGDFHAQRVEWTPYRDALDPLTTPTLRQRLRRLNHRLKGKLSYLVWEFRCTKQ